MIDTHFDQIKKVILRLHSERMFKAMKKDQAEQMKMAGPKSSNGLTSLKSKTARGSIHEKPSKTAGNVSANAKRDADVEEAIIKNTVREKLLQDPEL